MIPAVPPYWYQLKLIKTDESLPRSAASSDDRQALLQGRQLFERNGTLTNP